MDGRRSIGAMHAALGSMMAWVAVDTAMIDAPDHWPKWLLVPVLLAYGFGFFVAMLRSRNMR